MLEIDAYAPFMHAEHDFLIRPAQNTFPRPPISSKNDFLSKNAFNPSKKCFKVWFRRIFLRPKKLRYWFKLEYGSRGRNLDFFGL